MYWKYVVPAVFVLVCIPLLVPSPEVKKSVSGNEGGMNLVRTTHPSWVNEGLVVLLLSVLVMGCWYALNPRDDAVGQLAAHDKKSHSPKGDRVLHCVCLHGYLSSSAFMEMQLSKLGLKDENIELTFIEAPHESSASFDPLVRARAGEVFHYWFHFEQQDTPKDATAYVVNEMMKIIDGGNKRIDGIIGFSQGACVATDTMALICSWRNDASSSPAFIRQHLRSLPRFTVLLSSVFPDGILQSARHDDISLPINCPSLHVIGKADTYREESEGVHDLYSPTVSTRVTHEGGHDVNTYPPDIATTLSGWLHNTGRLVANIH